MGGAIDKLLNFIASNPISDSGWQELELIGGFSADGSINQFARYRKIGKVIYIEAYAACNAQLSTGWTEFAMQPYEKEMAEQYIYFPVANGRAAIRNDGKIIFSPNTNISAGQPVAITLIYTID